MRQLQALATDFLIVIRAKFLMGTRLAVVCPQRPAPLAIAIGLSGIAVMRFRRPMD